jgi:phage baseplate assembly protein W
MALIEFKSVGIKADAKSNNKLQISIPIGFKTPLRFGKAADSIFSMHFDIREQLRDNLKNLLLTNHGERLGLYFFGANLKPLLFEFNEPGFDSKVADNIKQAVATFMPYIQLDTMEIFDRSMAVLPIDVDLKVRILYSSIDFGITSDGLELFMRIGA